MFNVLFGVKNQLLSVEQNSLHADFRTVTKEIKQFDKISKNVIEMIKHNYLPLDESSQINMFTIMLQATSKILKKKCPKTAEFYVKQAESMDSCSNAYSVMLSNINANTVKPLEKLVQVDIPNLYAKLTDLDKSKDKYDEARRSFRTCAQEKIETSANELTSLKNEFTEQVKVVISMVDVLPCILHKAWRQLSLAIKLYHETCNNIMVAMLWNTSELAPFVGSFSLISSKKFDEYLNALGVGMFYRKLYTSATPTVVFSMASDGTWTFKTMTALKNLEIKFKLGEEFDETTFDGRKVKTVVTLEDGKLVQKQKATKAGEKDTEIVREIKGGELVVTMPLDGIVCTRRYKRN